MKELFSLLKPLRLKITVFMFLTLVCTACEIALPAIMSAIVDDGIGAKDFKLVWQLCLVMFGVASFGFLLTFISAKLAAFICTEFTKSARSRVYERATLMPLSEFNKIGTGALLTRSTQDINMLQDFLTMLMRSVIVVPVFIIGGSALAFTKDPYLSLIIFTFAPLIILLTYLLGKKLMPLFKKSHDYIDKQNTIVRERLSGIRVIRAFNKEQQEHERMSEATEIMADNIIKANVSFGLLTPLALFIINMITVLILYISSVRVQSGISHILVGDIMAILQYIALIMNAVFSSAMLIMFLPRLKVSVTRMNEILKAPQIKTDESGTKVSDGSIECNALSFYYPDAETPALANIKMQINRGEKVALIGGTGSGKSTLIMVLAGLYPKTSGSLFLGGCDYDNLTIDGISRNISTVYQKHDIFSGTVRENLDPTNICTDEQIFNALKTAQLDGFIAEVGLDYKLNQGGSNLSGGQKQRLSIARALLKTDAQIFLFDDSFSALDYLTEQKLRARLRDTLEGKTMIIATQRVATAKNCERIFVFERGSIIGSGTHAELMKSCDVYREIYISQSGGQL